MNAIDQAFRKAYSRRMQAKPATPSTDSPATRPEASPDLSVHPDAGHSAVVWIDNVTDQYLRRDEGHAASEPAPSGTAAGGPAARPRGFAPGQPAAPTEDDRETRPTVAEENDSPIQSLFHTEIAFAPFTDPAADGPANEPQQAAAAVADSPTRANPAVIDRPPAEVPAEPSGVQQDSARQDSAEPFVAVWEVDSLDFSETVTRLFGSPAMLKSIGRPLQQSADQGLRSLVVTGGPGSGKTTVAVGMAVSAAASGLRVALVDAAAKQGDATTLAISLNLDVSYGWLEAVRGGIDVSEVAVRSLHDRITVIPLVSRPESSPPTPNEFASVMDALRNDFDLVVVDGPSSRNGTIALVGTDEDEAAESAACGTDARGPIDAVIYVKDSRGPGAETAGRLMRNLRHCGVTGLGIVENFT